MTERQSIQIEDILRSKTSVGDIYTTALLLSAEIPNLHSTFILLIALALGEVVLQVSVAVIARQVLDGAMTRVGFNAQLIILAIILSLVAFIVLRKRQITQEKLALSYRKRGVARLSKNIVEADYEDLTAVPMAGLREIIMTDVDFSYRFFIEVLSQLIVVVFWLLAALAITLWFSPPLLLLMIVMGVLLFGSFAYGTAKHMELTGEKFARLANLSQKAREVVEVERIILSRQFGIRNFFLRQFQQAHEHFLSISLQQGKLTANLRSLILTLNSTAFLAIVLFGGFLIETNGLSAGQLIAILFIIGQLLAAVAQISTYAVRAAETATAGKRMGAYWQAVELKQNHTIDQPVEFITVRQVAFQYQNGPSVLENVSLELHTRQITALTAETGAGKSTLALLVGGLLKPVAGSIEINGNPNWHPQDLRPEQILYVGSKPILFEGSVKDNLLLDADSNYSDEALAKFFARINRSGKPFPIDEPIIGPNGTGVSSGQAQLIQLARAVLRDPDVIIFDEATSSLDMKTEAMVQEELLDWCCQRVCLVISHRRCPWTDNAAVSITW